MKISSIFPEEDAEQLHLLFTPYFGLLFDVAGLVTGDRISLAHAFRGFDARFLLDKGRLTVNSIVSIRV